MERKKLATSSVSLVKKPYNPNIFGKWVGKTDITDIFSQKYIMKKYKNILHSVPFMALFIGHLSDKVTKGVALYNASTDIGFLYPHEKKQIQEYFDLYRKPKKRFTVYFGKLVFKVKDELIAHAVLFIYDKNTHTVEYYDSNPTTYKQGIFQTKRKLKSMFREIYDKYVTIDFDTNNKLCPLIPYKYLFACESKHYLYDAGGSCLIWALWYLDFRLRNKDVPRKKAFEKALNEFKSHPEAICKFEIAYAQFIEDFVKDYNVKVIQGKKARRKTIKKL